MRKVVKDEELKINWVLELVILADTKTEKLLV